MTEPFIVINGHAPWCAYIKSLGWLEDDEPCDCQGWDDDEDDDFWGEDEELSS